MILHFHLAYNLIASPLAAFLPLTILQRLVQNGNYGVTVFFVISGYLITSTSLRRFGDLPRMPALTFYTFRFARIMPSLVLVLLIITILGLAGIPYFVSARNVSFALADLSIFTFWHNVLMTKYGYFNYCLNIYWSLSVEEVFYFSFPLLWIVLRKTWMVVAVWVVFMIAGPIYRRYSTDDIQYLYAYLACFDAIAIGCCTALAARKISARQEIRNALQVCAAALMIFVYLQWSISTNRIFGPTFMALGAGTFLLAEGMREEDVLHQRGWSPVAWLGRHSYELYLFHIIVLAAMRNVFAKGGLSPYPKLLWFAVFLLLSTLVAWVAARYYAQPLNSKIHNAFVR